VEGDCGQLARLVCGDHGGHLPLHQRCDAGDAILGNLTAVSFNGPDGKPLTLDHFAGKTVLLNLWATWCVPCREEMPA
ncbi:TlpA family protein disulfide reductase, partial [Rhizobium ruizarguesonis]